MPVSLNRWPAPPAELKKFKVPGTKRVLTLDVDAGRILTALVADYHNTVQKIDIGAVDDAGYSYRKARAADDLSNHSSGSAVDVNWTGEGAQGSNRGAKFFAQAKHRIAVQALKNRYGKWVQWGGDWRAKDYMHWEIKPGVTRKDILLACYLLNIDEEGVRAPSK